MMGAATHRLTRLLARDKALVPLRVPFVEYVGERPEGEVSEVPRGRGLRRVVGELLTNDFSLGPWVAGGLVAAWAVWPRATRLVAGVFALSAVSDMLHRGYAWLGAGMQRAQALASAVEVSEGPLVPREEEPLVVTPAH
jgi:hypothetical protein